MKLGKIRHFNYTSRRRVLQEDAVIVVRKGTDGVGIFALQALPGSLSPPVRRSRIRRAKRVASFMRFSFGSVGQIIPPAD